MRIAVVKPCRAMHSVECALWYFKALLFHLVAPFVVCFDEFNYPDSGKQVKRNNDFLRKLFLSCYKIIQ